jgi:hypothetical protein
VIPGSSRKSSTAVSGSKCVWQKNARTRRPVTRSTASTNCGRPDLIAVAGGDQRALGDGEHVLEDDQDVVVVDVRAGACRAAAVVLGVQADDRVGDGRAGGAAVGVKFVVGAR